MRKVERQHPTLICMILDDSGSMTESLPGTSDPKYVWVERFSGIILKELLARSMEPKGETYIVKPRYYVDVIKYGTKSIPWITDISPIDQAIEEFGKSDNSFQLGGKLGGTDAAQAFQLALQRVKNALKNDLFADSFPPMIFHLTDGMSDTNPESFANELKELSTTDGNILVVNAFIGANTSLSYTNENDFPGYLNENEVGANQDNLRLFRMSSVMPSTIRENLINDNIFPQIRENARLFFDVRTKEMLKHVIQVVGSTGSRRLK
jgi:hypothetical protein